MDRRLQALLDDFVGVADHRLEGRNHVADDEFRRIVQQDRQRQPGVDAAGLPPRDRIDQQGVLCDRKNMLADGLSVPPRHPREPVSDVLNLDIERRRIEQIEPAARTACAATPGRRTAFGGGTQDLRWIFLARCSPTFLNWEVGWRHRTGGATRRDRQLLSVQLGAGLVPVTRHHMIVDHADRLHERIDDRRADELEAAADEFFRHRARYRRFGRHLRASNEIG